MPGVQNWRSNDAAGRHVEIDWGSLGDGHDDGMDQNGGLRRGGQDWDDNAAGWNGKTGVHEGKDIKTGSIL